MSKDIRHIHPNDRFLSADNFNNLADRVNSLSSQMYDPDTVDEFSMSKGGISSTPYTQKSPDPPFTVIAWSGTEIAVTLGTWIRNRFVNNLIQNTDIEDKYIISIDDFTNTEDITSLTVGPYYVYLKLSYYETFDLNDALPSPLDPAKDPALVPKGIQCRVDSDELTAGVTDVDTGVTKREFTVKEKHVIATVTLIQNGAGDWFINEIDQKTTGDLLDHQYVLDSIFKSEEPNETPRFALRKSLNINFQFEDKHFGEIGIHDINRNASGVLDIHGEHSLGIPFFQSLSTENTEIGPRGVIQWAQIDSTYFANKASANDLDLNTLQILDDPVQNRRPDRGGSYSSSNRFRVFSLKNAHLAAEGEPGNAARSIPYLRATGKDEGSFWTVGELKWANIDRFSGDPNTNFRSIDIIKINSPELTDKFTDIMQLHKFQNDDVYDVTDIGASGFAAYRGDRVDAGQVKQHELVWRPPVSIGLNDPNPILKKPYATNEEFWPSVNDTPIGFLVTKIGGSATGEGDGTVSLRIDGYAVVVANGAMRISDTVTGTQQTSFDITVRDIPRDVLAHEDLVDMPATYASNGDHNAEFWIKGLNNTQNHGQSIGYSYNPAPGVNTVRNMMIRLGDNFGNVKGQLMKESSDGTRVVFDWEQQIFTTQGRAYWTFTSGDGGDTRIWNHSQTPALNATSTGSNSSRGSLALDGGFSFKQQCVGKNETYNVIFLANSTNPATSQKSAVHGANGSKIGELGTVGEGVYAEDGTFAAHLCNGQEAVYGEGPVGSSSFVFIGNGSDSSEGTTIKLTNPGSSTLDIDAVSGGSISLNMVTGSQYSINDIQIITTQQDPIANAGSGTEIATINLILKRMRDHGLIAT